MTVTYDDRQRLVHKFVDTWPHGPKAHIWADALASCDYARAKAAYILMRDGMTRTPSVADFRQAYATTAPAPPPAPVEQRLADPATALARFAREVNVGRRQLRGIHERQRLLGHDVEDAKPSDEWYRGADRMLRAAGLSDEQLDALWQASLEPPDEPHTNGHTP